MHQDRDSPNTRFTSDSRVILVGFVIAVLMLVGPAARGVHGTRRLVNAERVGAATNTRIMQLSAVLNAAIDAETGSRGFVITGDTSFLVPYTRAIGSAVDDIDRLDALYLGDSIRRPLLTRVRSALEAQQAHMVRTVDLRRREGATAAGALVASGRGRALTDSLRQSIDAIIVDERNALEVQRREMHAATTAATRNLILAGLIGIGLLTLAFVTLKRENRRRREAGLEVRALNDGLETRIAQVRRDLEASEARLEHALDRLLEGCALMDFDMRYRYVNPAAARQSKATVEHMIGRTVLEVFEGSEDSALVATLRRTLDHGEPQEVEIEFVFPDGTSGWFELHIQPVPDGLFALSVEITARVLAERARAASEGRLRALLKSIPDQVFVLNRNGVVIDYHTPIGAVPIAPTDGLMGQALAASLAPHAAAVLADAIRDVAQNGAARTVQYDDVRGTERTRLEAMIVDTEGDRLTVVVRDITTRESLEEQLRQSQKMEAVGQLTGGIAHDFNNVLTIIASNAEILAADASVDLRDNEGLREILLATRRGANMIAQLLSFSRRGMLRRERLAARVVVREFLSMLERLLPAHVRLELGSLNAPEAVLLDPGALEQMLANLCTNARDAMPQGGTILIECHSTWVDATHGATHPWVKRGPYVCVSVRDTGMGMHEETRRRIFEPFFTTKPTGVGTGLGMAMVYGMMKEHEGMVHVHSEVGKGTVVQLFFPVSEGVTPASASRRQSQPVLVLGGTECVLVAEDEPAIRLASRRALQSKGYEVLEAADGEQALALWHAHHERISLVISDLVMPNLGGIELVQRLRAEGSGIPVLFTSGYSPDTLYHQGEMPPNVGFLPKPWTLVELFSRVREVLDSRHLAS